ncbi:hypothetical protein AsAng_0059360 [Aureispira anguillae]|uniref:Uncharacterized protein n=1 Tax=Aureispira anguillae TaxID=2864201 RepID=A0A915YKZ5_9BACT|nr:hypothetical protein AsAng_0059360 [Aureispira anguillae]
MIITNEFVKLNVAFFYYLLPQKMHNFYENVRFRFLVKQKN